VRVERWILPALCAIVALTALRWGLLAYDRTDLFVDESQYWLWSRTPDWGYYSKPPLIAWVIGAVTSLLGDTTFAIRLPGAGLHGLTALILGAVAARRFGGAAALATVGTYLLAPFVAVGSLMISTDTVMLPFLAVALWCHTRLLQESGLRWALAAGVALGIASLGKYAGLYGLAAFLLANLFPESRIGWKASATMVAVCLFVLSPNLAWNLQNQFATLSATGDNIGWIKGAAPKGGIGSALEFVLAQAAVFGPVALVALGLGLRRAPRDLVLFALLPLILVTGQAFAAKAYANWALAAYAPASLIAGAFFAERRFWGGLSTGINLVFAVILPVLTLVPDITVQGRPILARYIGRSDLSQEILALARAGGGLPVVTPNRDILADLFYADRHWHSVPIYAPPIAQPRNFYEQVHGLQPDTAKEVLYIGRLPAGCAPIGPVQIIWGKGTWGGHRIEASRIPAECLFR
jgi:4-amino-4-deoxy-L-arabinose transferase-like glycosyltransferase